MTSAGRRSWHAADVEVFLRQMQQVQNTWMQQILQRQKREERLVSSILESNASVLSALMDGVHSLWLSMPPAPSQVPQLPRYSRECTSVSWHGRKYRNSILFLRVLSALDLYQRLCVCEQIGANKKCGLHWVKRVSIYSVRPSLVLDHHNSLSHTHLAGRSHSKTAASSVQAGLMFFWFSQELYDTQHMAWKCSGNHFT